MDEILEALNQQSTPTASTQVAAESDGTGQTYSLKADQDSLSLYTQLLANNLPLVSDHQVPAMGTPTSGALPAAVESAIPLAPIGRIERPPRHADSIA